MNRTAPLSAIVLVSSLVFACTASTAPEASPEETGKVSAAWGELACATGVAADATIANSSFFCPFSNEGHAATGTYGSPACPNQFVLELDNAHIAGWAGSAELWPDEAQTDSTSAACQALHAKMDLYGQAAGGAWTLLAQAVNDGSLIPPSTSGFSLPPQCTMSAHGTGGSPYITMTQAAFGTFSKFRLVGQAYKDKGVVKGIPQEQFIPFKMGVYYDGPCN